MSWGDLVVPPKSERLEGVRSQELLATMVRNPEMSRLRQDRAAAQEWREPLIDRPAKIR